ncbi:MAG: cation-translocating P-type ATPase [Planctomycetes bacterium]|nr:cation-translocating P-type ATPase [Planctomycetota bacterium]
MKPSVATSTPATGSATCHYCGLPMSGPALPEERSYCCFGCRFADGMAVQNGSGTAARPMGPASALGFSVFFTMNVVMMTMALWSYADQAATPFETSLRSFLRYGAMTFSLPVLLMLGRPLVSHAFTGLRRGVFTTDLLLATGVLAAYAVSIVHTLRGNGHVYFEVGCVILVLVTLGRWLEAGGRSHASAALEQLERLVPDMVRRWESGKEVSTPRLQIVVGDCLHVRAGERIPLDGRVWQGRGVVDEQFFTGESTPVEKQPGDSLLGGSLNLDGDLLIEATSPPTGGALGRLVEAVRTARLSKGRYQLLSDAWSQFFFPIIGVVAVAAFFVHGLRVNWDYGLLTALSVVLIACPCALALATPLAVWAALGTTAKRGVLFRSGAALENLGGVRAIRWDKTGTLTTGSPRVQRLFCERPLEQAEVERMAARITRASDHVFSQAIREYLAAADQIESLPGVQTVSGRGLRGIDNQGETIALGSVRWMDDCGLAWGTSLSAVLNEPQFATCPLTAIGFGGEVRGIFVLEETVRPEAIEALNGCQEMGLNQAVLTGDRIERAAVLAAALGLPVLAGLLPEDKLAAIRAAHQQFGRVAMVGDGLNDAPALAGADFGIALGCGADVSRDSADVCLLSSDLRLIPWAYAFSRCTVRTIRTNLAWSFGYNSLGVIVAASGQLHPAVAAALMVASSLMVLGNSLRLSTDGPYPYSDPGKKDSEARLQTESASKTGVAP